MEGVVTEGEARLRIYRAFEDGEIEKLNSWARSLGHAGSVPGPHQEINRQLAQLCSECATALNNIRY